MPALTTLTISVVIPTRNRVESLHRLLVALSKQDRPPDEVIVADASDTPWDERALASSYPTLRIACLRLPPSVCGQRNAGIRRATGSHVLLCDDDIEPPPDYIRRLAAHVERDPAAVAVTGILSEGGGGQPVRELRAPSFRSLLYAFVFQLTVWGDVEAARGTWLTTAPLAALKKWYRHRGNTWSLAGWPLVTQVRAPVMRTAIYGLGAALVRRDWLLASPYDEHLGAHGIGDNYGVALKFPGERSIAVLTELAVRHHRASENRLAAVAAYYQRLLALDYFMRTSGRFALANRWFLIWSLLGQAAIFTRARRWDMFRAASRAAAVIAMVRNPLCSTPGTAPPDSSHDGP